MAIFSLSTVLVIYLGPCGVEFARCHSHPRGREDISSIIIHKCIDTSVYTYTKVSCSHFSFDYREQLPVCCVLIVHEYFSVLTVSAF